MQATPLLLDSQERFVLPPTIISGLRILSIFK